MHQDVRKYAWDCSTGEWVLFHGEGDRYTSRIYTSYFPGGVPAIRKKAWHGETEDDLNKYQEVDWNTYPDQELLKEVAPYLFNSDMSDQEINLDEDQCEEKFKEEFPRFLHSRLVERFGGSDIGEEILNEGQGGGFYTIPYILDDYQRELGLTIGEMWLLKLLIRHVWNENIVFPNMTRIAMKANIHKRELFGDKSRKNKEGIIPSLKRKGFLKEVSDAPRGDKDFRVRYDMSNLWLALDTCIRYDPNSKLSRENGYYGSEGVKEWAEEKGFSLNWEALSKLQEQPDEE